MTIALSNVIPGAIGVYTNAGAPTAGTSEVQTLTLANITGGTFKLSYDGQLTGDITWSATTGTLIANIDAALEALPNIGTGNVTTADSTLSGGNGDLTVTFAGTLAKKAVSLIAYVAASSALTGSGATISVAETTPGVDTTHRGAIRGSLLSDLTNGKLYIATAANPPTWTVAGTQS